MCEKLTKNKPNPARAIATIVMMDSEMAWKISYKKKLPEVWKIASRTVMFLKSLELSSRWTCPAG